MSERFRRWLWAHPLRAPLLLGLLTVFVYSRTIHHGYVAYDTPWLVVNNPLLSGGSASSIPAILFGLDTGTRLILGAEYLPVRDLSVLLDHALFGRDWSGHHAQNLFWYVLGCLLFLAVLRTIFGERLRTFLGACLFAVHPVHVESVAWLASRKDVLSLALFMAALVLWQSRERSRARLVLAPLMFLLAYWAKNTAIVLPAFLVALVLLNQRTRPPLLRLTRDLLPYAAFAALGLSLTLSLGDSVGMFAAPRADSVGGLVAIQAQVIRQYFGMLLWPAELSVLYPEPTLTSLDAPQVKTALAITLSPLLVAALTVRRRPRFALGVAWFFLALLPVSQVVPIQNLIADRYLLLPSAGAIVAVAALVPEQDTRWDLPSLALGGIAVAVLSVMTLRQTHAWMDSVSLWRPVVERYPTEVRGWVSLAGALDAQGRSDDAAVVVESGLRRHAADPVLLQTSGNLYLSRGAVSEAEAVYSQALQEDPSLRKARHNLSGILYQTDRVEEGVEHAKLLVGVHPLFPDGWKLLGLGMLRLGDLEEAEAALLRASELAPLDAEVWFRRGSVRWLQAEPAKAREFWREALRIEPSHESALRALRLNPEAGP